MFEVPLFVKCKTEYCPYGNCTHHWGEYKFKYQFQLVREWFSVKWNGLVGRKNHMSKVSEIRSKIAELEAELDAATALPSESELKPGTVFENDEGQGRILIVDGANYRLVGAKKGQVLHPIFRSKAEVLEHMESNSYSRRV